MNLLNFKKTSETIRGFTLIEIVVIVGILLLICLLTFNSFSNLNKAQALDKDIMSVTSVLNQARSLTLSSKEGSRYGVRFENARVILFKGTSYSPSDSNNIYVTLSRYVRITSINIGGGENLVFERLTGKANVTGTVTLSLVQPPNTSRTVTISQSGIVEATP